MIIHSPKRDRFVIISKVPLEDERLSWKARGLHAYLLSKPDDWIVIVAHLVSQAPDGKASVMAGLKELEDAGYIVRTQRKKVKGRYDGLDCTVFEQPVKSPDETVSDFRTSHRVRFSASDNQPLLNTEVLKDELLKNESSVDVKKHARRAKEILRGKP